MQTNLILLSTLIPVRDMVKRVQYLKTEIGYNIV